MTEGAPQPRVSVVVPTHGRPELLRRCLDALLNQELEPRAYEIIVVDDARSDDTSRLVDRFVELGRTTGHTIRYVRSSEARGPAAARNAGWRTAHAEVVAFTDDDCIPDTGWLQAGLDVMADEVIGVNGRIIVPLPPCPSDYQLDVAGLERSEFATANVLYRRDALASVAGFDERFKTAWREDADLFFTLLEHGYNLVRAPRAVVTHPLREAPWGIRVGGQRKALYNSLLYKKHRQLYRERIQPSPPWHYYWMVGSLSATIAASSARRPRAALAFGSVWLLLTGRFCLQRLRNTSRSPNHILEMAVTSALVPPLALFWRLRGAIKFRVLFL